ncbi:MAG: exodeoxyribonuclease VII small subunit [Herminiimonas sp.]|nr:exodeoxyribonuclease VII small subunit [Herminiimonas sp.]
MPKKTLQESTTAMAMPMPESFELAMAELAQLVAQMEAGALPLEASVGAYRRGAELVHFCSAQLERVDQQVKLLEGDLLNPLAVSAAGSSE